MKRNEAGFTLIEIIAVIIILGIVLTIAVPSISKYINSSRRSAYVSDIDAYAKSAMADFLQKKYGSLPESEEILIVPFESITLEKNNTKKSPFGEFDLERSYIVVLPKTSGSYTAFIYAIDSAGYGIHNGEYKAIDNDDIVLVKKQDFVTLFSLADGTGKLSYNSKIYDSCLSRDNDILICTE